MCMFNDESVMIKVLSQCAYSQLNSAAESQFDALLASARRPQASVSPIVRTAGSAGRRVRPAKKVGVFVRMLLVNKEARIFGS